eukprot:CAMPEP_0198681454 /NCGR_PEP_ID=MMETSP1468-20131203/6819_1 /TAXON_ID=1461545 /ORGANISM="Mantoniella sp, Strain CCMP1436" /LENGTH=104 /DNA_ID=CAMNT_0044423163 /DNA_START=599 /DNA_END=914 /DNA_ORIENTATION=-
MEPPPTPPKSFSTHAAPRSPVLQSAPPSAWAPQSSARGGEARQRQGALPSPAAAAAGGDVPKLDCIFGNHMGHAGTWNSLGFAGRGLPYPHTSTPRHGKDEETN